MHRTRRFVLALFNPIVVFLHSFLFLLILKNNLIIAFWGLLHKNEANARNGYAMSVARLSLYRYTADLCYTDVTIFIYPVSVCF